MSSKNEDGNGAKYRGMFMPEIGRFSEVTARTKFSRKVVIEEEFSESEVSIVTGVGEVNNPTTGSITPKKSNNSDMSDVRMPKVSVCPLGSESNEKESVPEANRVSDEKLGRETPSSPRRRKSKLPIPDTTQTAQNNDPRNEMVNDGSENSQMHRSPKKRFKNTVSKVNSILLAGRPSSDTVPTSCPCTAALSVQTAAREGDQMLNLRRKSYCVDGLREFQVTKIDSCLLYGVLRPLLIAMKAAGIFYAKENNRLSQVDDTISHGTRSKHGVTKKLHVAYCVLICLIFTANFILSFWALVSIEHFHLSFETTFALTWCILWLESLLKLLVCLVTCAVDSMNLTVLLCHIERVCYKDHIIPYEQSLSKFLKVFFSLSFIDIVLAIVVNIDALFFNDSLIKLFQNLWHYAGVDTNPIGYTTFRVAVLVSIALSKASSALNTSLFAVITYILYKEFVFFCRNLAAKITAEGDFPSNLEKFRLNHEARCRLVDTTNSVFKYYLTVVFLTNTPPLCFLGYSLIESGLPVVYKLYGLYWMIWFILQLGVVSTMAIKVNTQAHAPLSYIHSLKAKCVTMDRNLEINVFMNRLTGTCIGLTAWDLFTINKPTLLTILGLILTYFFLLVQFRNPLTGEAKSDVECRCVLNISAEFEL